MCDPIERFRADIQAILTHVQRLDQAGVEGVSDIRRDLEDAFERLERETE